MMTFSVGDLLIVTIFIVALLLLLAGMGGEDLGRRCEVAKWDLILIHLGVGFLVALAAALGYWDSVAGGEGGMVALDVMWWVERRRSEGTKR